MSPHAPRNSRGTHARASPCTAINLRIIGSTWPIAICPLGCRLMVIIMPMDPAISAQPLKRSSVMRRTVECKLKVVNPYTAPDTEILNKEVSSVPKICRYDSEDRSPRPQHARCTR